MSYLCDVCGGVGGLFKSDGRHSADVGCVMELLRQRDKLRKDHEEVAEISHRQRDRAERAELQVGACRSVLADAVRGHCTICGMGGDASKQNHHEDCEARKLITESRIGERCDGKWATSVCCILDAGHVGKHSDGNGVWGKT